MTLKQLLLFLCFFGAVVQANAVVLKDHPKIRSFISSMVTDHRFDHDKLSHVFKEAKIEPLIIEKMDHPYEAKPWYIYRELFATPKRVRDGVRFWQRHKKTLAAVEQHYGVPASVIVAIIGIETDYGKQRYAFRVIDALTTLAFQYPKRARFFRSELEQYLLLSRENQLDPLFLSGSYAGAIGLPQFMPSSLRRYAVNFNTKTKLDLMNNENDAIASVGNYLKAYGWEKGGPLVTRPRIDRKHHMVLAPERKYRPKQTLASFAKEGVHTRYPLLGAMPAILIRLEERHGYEYWLAFNNFYVITRYNNSKLYAMTAHELSYLIKDAMQAEKKRRRARSHQSA